MVIDVNPDARVFAFTAALAILTALLFGLAPALHGTRVDLTAAMKASRGSPSAGTLRRRALLRPGLVVCQLTLAVPRFWSEPDCWFAHSSNWNLYSQASIRGTYCSLTSART